jgi:hypothetical protein
MRTQHDLIRLLREGICWIQPLCSATAKTASTVRKTFVHQLGALAVADALLDVVFMRIIYLRHKDPCNLELSRVCRPAYYTLMAASWCFWLFGVNIALNALFQVQHFTKSREILLKYQHLVWVISFVIPLQAFHIKEWTPHTDALFCLADPHDQAGYDFALTMSGLWALCGGGAMFAFCAARAKAGGNSTGGVQDRQTERVKWLVTLCIVSYSPSLVSLHFFLVKRAHLPKWLVIWWSIASFTQGFVNLLLFLNLKSASFKHTNHVAFAPTDSIFMYYYR